MNLRARGAETPEGLVRGFEREVKAQLLRAAQSAVFVPGRVLTREEFAELQRAARTGGEIRAEPMPAEIRPPIPDAEECRRLVEILGSVEASCVALQRKVYAIAAAARAAGDELSKLAEAQQMQAAARAASSAAAAHMRPLTAPEAFEVLRAAAPAGGQSLPPTDEGAAGAALLRCAPAASGNGRGPLAPPGAD